MCQSWIFLIQVYFLKWNINDFREHSFSRKFSTTTHNGIPTTIRARISFLRCSICFLFCSRMFIEPSPSFSCFVVAWQSSSVLKKNHRCLLSRCLQGFFLPFYRLFCFRVFCWREVAKRISRMLLIFDSYKVFSRVYRTPAAI